MDLSTGSLLASLVTGTVGFAIFSFGKKQVRAPQILVGLAMMTYPYFVSGIAWILGIGVGLVALLLALLRLGL